MHKYRVLFAVLVGLILLGCAPTRLYFKPATFPTPVPLGAVVEEKLILSEGPPASFLKVATVGLYERRVDEERQPWSLHLRFTFVNNRAQPLFFYPGETRIATEKKRELKPTLIDKTRLLAPGEPVRQAPGERRLPTTAPVEIEAHSLVQFDLFFDLPQDFEARNLRNFVTYFQFQADETPVVASLAFTRVRETYYPRYYYYDDPWEWRFRFGFSYIE